MCKAVAVGANQDSQMEVMLLCSVIWQVSVISSVSSQVLKLLWLLCSTSLENVLTFLLKTLKVGTYSITAIICSLVFSVCTIMSIIESYLAGTLKF